MKSSIQGFCKLAALLLTIFLMNFSCEDHQIPEVLPVLKTLPITDHNRYPQPTTVGDYIRTGHLIVEEKGNVTVVEYGVVYTNYTAGELQFPENINKLPSVGDAYSVKFNIDFEAGEQEDSVCCFARQLRTDVFQRAYAKLADGRIIYGDVVWTVAGKVTPM